MGGDDAFDIIVILMIVTLLLPITVTHSVKMFRGDIGGFNTQIEKTALKTQGEIVPQSRKITRDDIILMMTVADKYTPAPKRIQINVDSATGPDIPIDNVYFSSKASKLGEAYGNMSYTGNLKMQLYVGNTGMRKWVVTRE